jgi:hypothetical protein
LLFESFELLRKALQAVRPAMRARPRMDPAYLRILSFFMSGWTSVVETA